MYYEYAPDPYAVAERQTATVAAQCGLCGDELYFGQCCYHLEGVLVCDSCLAQYARAYFRTNRVRLRTVQQP